MKQKKIFILAAAALAFAACSSDESPTAPEEQETGAAYTQGEVPVAFGAYVNRGTTRAGAPGELDATALKDGFGVFAYYTDNQDYSETSIPNFMYNQKVYKPDTKWTYNPVKYWPNEFGTNATSDGVDKLTFFAYAPYVEDVDVKTGRITGTADKTSGIVGMTSNTTTGDPYVKYCVGFNPAEQVDLCWGVAKTAFTSAVDGANDVKINCPYVNVIKPKVNDNIDFMFYHALASLNVTIDADVDVADHPATHPDFPDKNTRIWVRSVTFEGFTDKGALNLNSLAPVSPATVPTPYWFEFSNFDNEITGADAVTIYDGRRDGREGLTKAANEKPFGINRALIQGDVYATWNLTDGLKIGDGTTYTGVTKDPVNLFQGTTPSDPIYVIPTGDELKVTIVYDVETYDDKVAGYLSDGKSKGSTIENKITKTVFATFDPGKKYIINLHLGMTSVNFDATVDSWDDATGSPATVDLPKNEPNS